MLYKAAVLSGRPRVSETVLPDARHKPPVVDRASTTTALGGTQNATLDVCDTRCLRHGSLLQTFLALNLAACALPGENVSLRWPSAVLPEIAQDLSDAFIVETARLLSAQKSRMNARGRVQMHGFMWNFISTRRVELAKASNAFQ